MNKIAISLISIISCLVFRIANAADLTYFPQSLVNCTIYAAVPAVCPNADKTYIWFDSSDMPSTPGTYSFQFQGAFAEYDPDAKAWSMSWSYIDAVTKQEFLTSNAFGSIIPDLKARGNLWTQSTSSKNQDTLFICGRSFPFSPIAPPATTNQCPYTHTPFVNPGIMNNASLTRNVSIGTNQIIINNFTNQAIALHADDYNNSTITFTRFVPPNTQNFIAATYKNPDPKNFSLMFDTQIVADGSIVQNRNSDNTVVFTATIAPDAERFTYENYILPFNPQEDIVVKPTTPYPFPIDANGNIYISAEYASRVADSELPKLIIVHRHN